MIASSSLGTKPVTTVSYENLVAVLHYGLHSI